MTQTVHEALAAFIEKEAEKVYNEFPYNSLLGRKPPWVPHGNSIKQDEARDIVKRQLLFSRKV